jgi:hypothetical protein
MAFVDLNGLNYFYTKLKSKFALSSHSHSVATTSANGFMSSTDKTKLNGVATGATKNNVTQTTVTLTSSGWGSNKQTVTVSGVTASNLVIVSVLNNSYGIECTAQASNTLTFTCKNTPTVNVTVNVVVIV